MINMREFLALLTLLLLALFVFGSNAPFDEIQRRREERRALYEVSINSTAIKGYRGKSIYILDDGVKHLIPDWITFLRLEPSMILQFHLHDILRCSFFSYYVMTSNDYLSSSMEFG